jgi:16S rRNA (cytosine967-C5)-methyltransferase
LKKELLEKNLLEKELLKKEALLKKDLIKTTEKELIAEILTDVLCDKKFNNLALKSALRDQKLSAAFVTECVNGVLRNLLYVDFIIDSFADVKKQKPFVVNLIRCAVYQLIFTNSHPNAVVNDSVNIVKKRYPALAGFTNGLLRNILRDTPKPPNISIKYSVPQWILNYWGRSLDGKTIEKICEAQNRPPALSICANTLKISKEDLIDVLKLENIESDGVYIKKVSDITRKDSFKNGYYYIMDISSMKCVESFSPRGVIFDLCAAPGGKSFYAAIRSPRSQIFSFDIYPHKIDLINKTKKRLGIKNVTVALNDATVFNPELKAKADIVLADAPCSGLGTLAKKPDIKYKLKPSDIDSLAALQKKILRNALYCAKPGGLVVYSVCAISERETTEVVKNCNVVYEKMILPHEYGSQGFYTAHILKEGFTD